MWGLSEVVTIVEYHRLRGLNSISLSMVGLLVMVLLLVHRYLSSDCILT